MKLQRSLRFNVNEAQFYDDPVTRRARECRFAGRCVVCQRRTYGFTDGDNDPRGVLGLHAAAPLLAREFKSAGPDVPVCWGCRNDDARSKVALEIAKLSWGEIDEKP